MSHFGLVSQIQKPVNSNEQIQKQIAGYDTVTSTLQPRYQVVVGRHEPRFFGNLRT